MQANTHVKPIRLAGLTTALLAIALPCVTPISAAESFEAQFHKITVGLTGDAVIGLVGRQPDSEVTTVILTFPEVVWRWSEPAGHSYMVVLIKDRVVITRSCFAASNC